MEVVVMDDVDYRYKDSIRESLQTENMDKLMELVPSLSEQDAQYYIQTWKQNYLEIMQKIRNGLDTTNLDNEQHEMLFNLIDKAQLSGYHR